MYYSRSRRTFKENTELIVKVKEMLPAWKAESISGALYGIVKEREMLLNEIYSWQEDELKRLLTELGKANAEDVTDRINLTYQIGKLIMLLKEAIDRFGYEYIETYVDYKEINRLIQKETSNMIFLEDIQNDRR